MAAPEVVSDFAVALDDLSRNDKYEIQNLTVIARENTEHAQEFSKTLETHIRKTQPSRKLPALYLMDSIVKNVGSPYTVYFGRNLYTTFMEAYRSVDEMTRRNMEGMLKTWREPVPNSTDPKPVFQVEVVAMIQNALQKARANASQGFGGPHPMHGLPPRPPVNAGQPWRHTGTPPMDTRFVSGSMGMVNGYPSGPYNQPFAMQQSPPPGPYYSQSPQPAMMGYPYPPPVPMQQHHLATQQNFYPQPPPPNPQQPGPEQALLADIDQLTNRSKENLARNPYDTQLHGVVAALDQLAVIVRTHYQHLPPEQKQGIIIKVQELKLAEDRKHSVPPTPLQHYQQPAITAPQPFDLAKALGEIHRTRTATPPQQQLASPPPLQPTPSSTNTDAASSLLATLRNAGLTLPESATPLPGLGSLARPALTESQYDVKLNSASLRQPRPHLVKLLYQKRPNQCSTCARRFEATPEGKAEKANHMDFHFRVNRAMADTTRRGMSRNWFLGEREWIDFKEIDDAQDAQTAIADADGSDSNSPRSSSKSVNKLRFIKAPSDPALKNQPCPICQEKFSSVWSDMAQDWVWMDAVQAGGRIYHAACHEEVTKNSAQSSTRSPSSTPVLGHKRKAEGSIDHGGSKLKRELVA